MMSHRHCLLALIVAVGLASLPSVQADLDIARFLCNINYIRAHAGKSALGYSPELNAAAQIQSDAQATLLTMTHEGLDGSIPSERIKEQGFDWSCVAENVAYGYSNDVEALAAWMNSPGHKANILMDGITHVGLAYSDANGVNFWTQDLAGTASGMAVQTFACQSDQRIAQQLLNAGIVLDQSDVSVSVGVQAPWLLGDTGVSLGIGLGYDAPVNGLSYGPPQVQQPLMFQPAIGQVQYASQPLAPPQLRRPAPQPSVMSRTLDTSPNRGLGAIGALTAPLLKRDLSSLGDDQQQQQQQPSSALTMQPTSMSMSSLLFGPLASPLVRRDLSTSPQPATATVTSWPWQPLPNALPQLAAPTSVQGPTAWRV